MQYYFNNFCHIINENCYAKLTYRIQIITYFVKTQLEKYFFKSRTLLYIY